MAQSWSGSTHNIATNAVPAFRHLRLGYASAALILLTALVPATVLLVLAHLPHLILLFRLP